VPVLSCAVFVVVVCGAGSVAPAGGKGGLSVATGPHTPQLSASPSPSNGPSQPLQQPPVDGTNAGASGGGVGDEEGKGAGGKGAEVYGLLGLLSVIRMTGTHSTAAGAGTPTAEARSQPPVT
jgi:hypothetical protein